MIHKMITMFSMLQKLYHPPLTNQVKLNAAYSSTKAKYRFFREQAGK